MELVLDIVLGSKYGINYTAKRLKSNFKTFIVFVYDFGYFDELLLSPDDEGIIHAFFAQT